MVRRGEIYDYDFGGVGADRRQAGRHPALVVQTDLLNSIEGYELTLIVPLTIKGRPTPSHVKIAPDDENGLADLSFAKCEQVFTVPTKRLEARRGMASRETILRVNQALGIVLGLS